ncbi:MAG: L-lactate dehydrogenase [Clostridia bacterium]|nr:L-lactate dehydrogenase [Clostridia bacterium]
MERKLRFDLRIGGCDIRKCGILGCGRIGTTVAYTLMQTGWFSDLVLIDPDYRVAEIEAADMAHALPFHTPMDIYAGDYADLSDCGLIILAPEVGQEYGGEDRSVQCVKQLRTATGNILLYNQNAILINVCEPVEELSHMIYRTSGYPASRVIGIGTVLETARLKQMVGRYLGVDSRNVHSFIIGEHGENEIPVWSSANVSGVDLSHYCDSCGRGYDKAMLDGLFRDVRDSACRIAGTKGAGYYAIAESVKRIVSAIVRDEHTILTVSALAEGHYGLEDVYLSLPCIVSRGGVKRVLEIPLDEDEETRLRRAAKRLKEPVR